jgi:O-antigen/teichoic acid export membrane protein
VVAPVQPAVTAMHATGDHARIGRAYLRGGRYALWVVLLLAVPLCVYSESFVQLYLGGPYEQAALVIVLLIVTYLFDFPTFLLGAVSMAKARVRFFFVAAVVTQVLAVGLMIAGVLWLPAGAIAVAAATLISRAVMNLAVFWPYGLRLAGVSARQFGSETLVRGMMPALIGVCIWSALLVYDAPGSWAELVLYGAVGAAGYLAVLLTRCMETQERGDVNWGVARLATLLRLQRGQAG